MKSTPSQLANLRPQWGPNNPPPKSPGRPRKRPMSEANDDLLRRAAPPQVVLALCKLGLPKDATNADVLALCLFREGLAGNVYAVKELRESTEGRAPLRVELLGREDVEINIAVSFEHVIGASGGQHVEKIIDVEPAGSTDELPEPDDTKELPDDGDAEK